MLNIFQKIPRKAIVEILVLTVLLCWYGLFLCHKIDLTTADLGRHLKNGELILENFSFENPVLKTNFYSFTEPQYPTINHHWLSGIVFFLVFKATGFVGIHLFFIVLSFLAFWLFFRLAKDGVGLEVATVLGFLLIPLIAERSEVRPEVFSYVLAGVFLNLLWQWRQGKIKSDWLWLLPLLEVFWVNLHLYFFVGSILVGVFLLESVFVKERRKYFVRLALLFLLVYLASLINPFGFQGAIVPLTIFKSYGYRLVENQSIWFLERLGFITNPNFFLFKLAALILVLSSALVLKLNRQRFSLVNLCLGLGFLTAGALALRNFTIFGFFTMFLIADNLKVVMEKFPLPSEVKIDFLSLSRNSLLTVFCVAIICFSVVSQNQRLSISRLGLGLAGANSRAADFFKKNQITGPIFNNYDIGGYLIYHLFPKERVFVDNRPEAYSKEFFEKEYIPMQEDESKWQEAQIKYGFNAIFFAWHDATPWGQQFLTGLIKNSHWAPVFADQFAIIFLKRNEQNQQIIGKYEISRDYFKIVQ